jgi:hypothetical protein
MKSARTLLRVAAAFSLACLSGLAFSATTPSTITVSACTNGTFDSGAETLFCPNTGTSLSVAVDQSCAAPNAWLWSAATGTLACGTPKCSIINTATNATGPFTATAGTSIKFGVSCNYFTPVNYDWSPTGLACSEASGRTGTTCTVTSATAISGVTVQANVDDGTCGPNNPSCNR